jgi:hypothetical protein
MQRREEHQRRAECQPTVQVVETFAIAEPNPMIAARQRNEFVEYANVSTNGGVSRST